jgi:hypothetical protein
MNSFSRASPGRSPRGSATGPQAVPIDEERRRSTGPGAPAALDIAENACAKSAQAVRVALRPGPVIGEALAGVLAVHDAAELDPDEQALSDMGIGCDPADVVGPGPLIATESTVGSGGRWTPSSVRRLSSVGRRRPGSDQNPLAVRGYAGGRNAVQHRLGGPRLSVPFEPGYALVARAEVGDHADPPRLALRCGAPPDSPAESDEPGEVAAVGRARTPGE